MSESGHDTAVAFANTVVTGEAIDIAAWDCQVHHDGDIASYYARGPCPACHADTQGHIDDAALPIESLGPEAWPRGMPSESVEIPVRCTCGHDHGRQGATGCGRRWSILCPRQQP